MRLTIWIILTLATILASWSLYRFGFEREAESELRPGQDLTLGDSAEPRRSTGPALENPAAARVSGDEAASDSSPVLPEAPGPDREAPFDTGSTSETRVSGKVVDQVGQPVAGAALAIEILGPAPWWRARPGTAETPLPDRLMTTSDANGGFSFAELPIPARGLLVVEDPRSGAAAGTPIESGMVKIIRIYVGSTIEGLVVDENGLPIAGLLLATRQVEAEKSLDRDDLFNGEVWTRSTTSGQFRFAGVPPGPTRIACESESFWIEGTTIEVERGGSHHTRVVARTTLTIAGRLNRDGLAAPDLDIMAVPESGTWREGFAGGFGRSDGEGRFSIGGLRPGRFTLVIQRRMGPVAGDLRRTRDGLESTPTGPFKLRGIDAGTTDLDIDINR